MSSGNPNPYISPGVVPEAKKSYSPGTLRFDYGAMFQFGFNSPNWFTNFMWGSLCLMVSGIIPILPQLVFFGYLWMVFDYLHLTKSGAYPDFDVNRFSDYLTRAIWPFLASLLASMVFVVFLLPMIFCSGFLGAMADQNGGGGAGVLLMIVLWMAIIAFSIAINLLILPITIRAGIAQDLGQAFNFGWAREFIGLVWKEMILGALALIAMTLGAYVVGCALFCIGIYPAICAVMFAATHYQWQLYEIFLDRGGTPVPTKQPAYVAPVNVPPPQY